MSIPYTKRYTITKPDGSNKATVVAVLPKNADVDAYKKDAAKRFDWKSWEETQASLSKVRVGQQKQAKRRK